MSKTYLNEWNRKPSHMSMYIIWDYLKYKGKSVCVSCIEIHTVGPILIKFGMGPSKVRSFVWARVTQRPPGEF